ncbi:hypothetical protein [Chlorobium sp. KB01]|uniref:hypothetical protein n=1 Tax=Chlorobium sp. KB01 TaxID=1917528 RepID=UPI0009786643|nr:hypothetical protein [Chlorobium sp. KB01]
MTIMECATTGTSAVMKSAGSQESGEITINEVMRVVGSRREEAESDNKTPGSTAILQSMNQKARQAPGFFSVRQTPP